MHAQMCDHLSSGEKNYIYYAVIHVRIVVMVARELLRQTNELEYADSNQRCKEAYVGLIWSHFSACVH